MCMVCKRQGYELSFPHQTGFYARTKHKWTTIGKLRQARGDQELEATPREFATPIMSQAASPDCNSQFRAGLRSFEYCCRTVY
jgi:hypothetical protein